MYSTKDLPCNTNDNQLPENTQLGQYKQRNHYQESTMHTSVVV